MSVISGVKRTPNKILNDYIRDEGKMLKTIAPMLNTTASNLSKILRKDDISVGMLLKLSVALKHDFLTDISKECLPADLTKSNKNSDSDSEFEKAVLNVIKKHFTQKKIS